MKNLIAALVICMIPAGHVTHQGCHVDVNGHPHRMSSGQLLSYPDMQVLCINGTVYIESRLPDR